MQSLCRFQMFHAKKFTRKLKTQTKPKMTARQLFTMLEMIRCFFVTQGSIGGRHPKKKLHHANEIEAKL